MLNTVNELIKKFRININQIIANSDNTMDDIINEAYIVVNDNYLKIQNNDRIFINQLKTNCLKFNKYGKRIESKKRWNRFNEYENKMVKEFKNSYDINEDNICMKVDIINIIGENNYLFLLDFYTYPYKELIKKYKLSEPTIRKKARNLIEKIKMEVDSYGRNE